MYRIEEFSEILVDACLRNSEGQFMFMSLYGRDGSIMQLMAAMDLSERSAGMRRLHLVKDGKRHPMEVAGSKRLAKHATRLPKQNLFGPLNHMWLFDKSLQRLDRVNRIGWVLHFNKSAPQGQTKPLEQPDLRDKAWQTINLLSPLALLPHWREPVLSWCVQQRLVAPMDDSVYPPLGAVQAMRVSLTEHFVPFISSGVRAGVLTL